MTDETPEPDQDPQPTWREPLLAFAAVVVALFIATGLASLWGLLADNLLAVAAIIFIGVPYFILSRKGADFSRFGIDFERIPLRQVGIGLLVTTIVFPLFAIGNHIWEVHALERDFSPDIDHYRKWSVELEAPPLDPTDEEIIQVRTNAGRLYIGWRNTTHLPATIDATGDRPFTWRTVGSLSTTPTTEAPATDWQISPTATGTDGRLTLSPLDQPENAAVPNRLELQFPDAPDAVYLGNSAHPTDEPTVLHRTHWWLLLWALTHLILVALPEEYFYRGYLQTRFSTLLGETDGPRKFLGFSRANWLTSLFFALGHVLIPIGGAFSVARAAVFFPSLIFGALRERTGSVVAPIIFHAGANMMVLVVTVHYF